MPQARLYSVAVGLFSPAAMQITVLYFASARERAGTSREMVEVPAGLRVPAIREWLGNRHPQLAPVLSRMRIAVNQEFEEESVLEDGDEIAVIPPVAGGIEMAKVVNRPIELREVVDAVRAEGCGGIVTFAGNVRGDSHGKRVLRLEYEAYGPMAEERLRRIGAEVEQKWIGSRIGIVHRIGVLEVGETAVLIAVAAPHRQAAFEACAYAIDRLKQDVPIWKKEVFEDGTAWVGLGP
jgi:molybdopterin converting factor subunit 1